MYAASGQIVEYLSGQTWEEFVRTKIFIPLNMSHSIFIVEDMQKQPDFMTPYYEKRDTNILLPYPFYTKQQELGPAGSIISNINDLSNWLIAQMNGGKSTINRSYPIVSLKKPWNLPALPHQFRISTLKILTRFMGWAGELQATRGITEPSTGAPSVEYIPIYRLCRPIVLV